MEDKPMYTTPAQDRQARLDRFAYQYGYIAAMERIGEGQKPKILLDSFTNSIFTEAWDRGFRDACNEALALEADVADKFARVAVSLTESTVMQRPRIPH